MIFTSVYFFSLFLFVFSFQDCNGVSSTTPRIIALLGPTSNFTLIGINKKIKGHIVTGTLKQMMEEISKLDRCSSNHIMFIKSPLPVSFATKLGYTTLSLHKNFSTALKQLKQKIAELPSTEADLPQVNPRDVGLFYDLMMKVDVILKKHDITYWCTCGSCLGAARHQGMIPWDDDIDIAIFYKDLDRFLAIEDELSKYGLELCYHPYYEFYKICPKNGQKILGKNGDVYPWKYPFIDVFLMKKHKKKYTYSGKAWKDFYIHQDFYWPCDLKLPLPLLQFGPMQIPVAHRHIEYVRRMYGDDWNDVAYVSYSHKLEKFLKKIKVDLVDRSPPDYVLP